MAASNVSAPARRPATPPEVSARPVAGRAAAASIGRAPKPDFAPGSPAARAKVAAPGRPPALAAPPEPDPDLPGCKAVPMSSEAVSRYEGRFEFWSARSGMAWMVRDPTGPDHESPASRLVAMTALIAAVRGSPIECFGSMDLLLGDERGRPREIMQADQTVYLDPSRAQLAGERAMVVGRHHYPDVVLEVDHTTDVRRGKLGRYESWGFPEVWVETPESWTPSRPRGLSPGLTVYLLEGGRYRESPESRAFPGWRARSIHEAMNESELSGWTHMRLERLGRVLGEWEGTGPDDSPLLRSLRDESRSEGRAEGEAKGRAQGLTEGRAKGRAEGLAEAVREVLGSRGIECSERFLAELPDELARAGAVESRLAIAAAFACEGERDFLARIRAR